MKNVFLLFLLLFLKFSALNAQTVVAHPVPEEFASDYYSVKVNGQQVPVFHAGLNVYFAGFDFTGSAEVMVSAKNNVDKYPGQTANKETVKEDEKGYWRGIVQVKPLSRNVRADLNGPAVGFKLDSAGQYSVERAGTSHFKDDVIFIFANRPETIVPKMASTNIIYLKAGIHQKHIDLKSGQTLYMDAGAVLFGSINVWDAKDVKILGRGTVVYYGPQSEDHDDGWKHQKNWHPLTTHNVQGLTVRGITFVGRSRTWSIQTHTTFDAVFDNIKIIAVNPQNINGDGIDWYGGGRTKVMNSLIRSMDDCFAFFTPESSNDMWGEMKNTTGEVKDIEISNCVLWTTLANIFRIGFNGQALTTNNISIENVDVIHISKGNWYAPWSLFCVVSPNSMGKARHSNYRVENVRFEEPLALFGFQNPEAAFTKLVFKDVVMTGVPIPSLIQCKTSDFTFENVIFNQQPVLNEAAIPLRNGSISVENAAFKH
ncbi:hypothetical protein L0663_17765 [Dyadobacter sp. CY107]|uniref:hypothetical protein n=1 Tax=Dyadobacter fanqingshengii TaxID=2906443 RepID=UPI001F1FC36B|nr:hypothetical protein [Dyadobacter fanqingshengii]MCF2505244.1 hypothetical protein [Dyadobacter fanqingshengii]